MITNNYIVIKVMCIWSLSHSKYLVLYTPFHLKEAFSGLTGISELPASLLWCFGVIAK